VAAEPKRGSGLAVGGFIVLAALLFFVIGFTPSCQGYEDRVVEMANACPLAVKALGGRIERRTIGWSPSSSSGRGSIRTVGLSIPVRGPKGDGSIDVDGLEFRDERPAALRSAILEVGRQRVDVRHCGAPSAARLWSPRSFSGNVTSARGPAPFAVRDACTVTIAPTKTLFPCRASFTCGGKRVLDAEGDGYIPCAHVVTGPETSALVGKTTDVDCRCNEPSVDFDERRRSVQVAARDGKWALSIGW
jgi:hypothetical protein